MALNTVISNANAIGMLDFLVDSIDGGPAAGYVEIRSGTQPADVSVAATGTVLATITLQDPAFGNAADNTGSARATMQGTPSDSSADAGGTAGWFRCYDSTGVGILDGECGTSGADMNLDSTTITAGQTVTITSWTIDMPES